LPLYIKKSGGFISKAPCAKAFHTCGFIDWIGVL